MVARDGYNMLVVRLFNNADASLRYLQVIRENAGEITGGMAEGNYRMAVISADNYGILEGHKAFNTYYLFYRGHYENQE